MTVFRMTEAQLEARIKAKAARADAELARRLPEYPVLTARVVSLELPWPPTANTNVRHAKGGHYLTAKHREFRDWVAAEVVAKGLHKAPLVGKLRVTIHASPIDARRRDLDNIAKPILDACQHAGLFQSDSDVDDLRVLRIKGKPGVCNVFLEVI